MRWLRLSLMSGLLASSVTFAGCGPNNSVEVPKNPEPPPSAPPTAGTAPAPVPTNGAGS